MRAAKGGLPTPHGEVEVIGRASLNGRSGTNKDGLTQGGLLIKRSHCLPQVGVISCGERGILRRLKG